MIKLPCYINGSKKPIIIWKCDAQTEEIKELLPGELHLFLNVTRDGWRQIKFWNSITSTWDFGLLKPFELSVPLWYYLFKNGIFTTKVILFFLHDLLPLGLVVKRFFNVTYRIQVKRNLRKENPED